MIISPSERTKGRKEIIIVAIISFSINMVYKPILINRAKSGSVSPEKVNTKYSGEQIKMMALIVSFSRFSFWALLKVKKMVNNATIALNTLPPQSQIEQMD